MAQLFDAPVVGSGGPDFGDAHHLCPIDKKLWPEVTAVPKMEQGHVQTYMTWVQTAVLCKFSKDTVQMSNIVDSP